MSTSAKHLVSILPFFALLLLAACDPVGACNDAGGRWVEEIGECECTYEDRGNFDIHITEEEYEKCRKTIPSDETQMD